MSRSAQDKCFHSTGHIISFLHKFVNKASAGVVMLKPRIPSVRYIFEQTKTHLNIWFDLRKDQIGMTMLTLSSCCSWLLSKIIFLRVAVIHTNCTVRQGYTAQSNLAVELHYYINHSRVLSSKALIVLCFKDMHVVISTISPYYFLFKYSQIRPLSQTNRPCL